MAAKTEKKANDTLPLKSEDLTPSSAISYNNEVVAIIAGLAANEVEGIAGMCSVSGSLMSKNRNITKGVKVEVGTEEVAVDLYVIVEYGTPIQRAAADAQENVRKAIESMTGLHVVRVDVHVQSVSFEQEKKALQAGAQNAALDSGDTEQVKLPGTKTEKSQARETAKKSASKPAKETTAQSEKKEESKPEQKPESKGKVKADPKPKTEQKTKAAKEVKTPEPETKAQKTEENQPSEDKTKEA